MSADDTRRDDATESYDDDPATDESVTAADPATADDPAAVDDDAGWVPWGGGGGLAFLPWYRRGVDDEAEPVPTADRDDEDGGSQGFFSLLLLVGVVLFVIPEPATSLIGIILVLVGAAGWLFAELL